MTGAPDIVVEIGSPSTRRRDQTIKRRLYETSGVEEYWVVDPDIDTIRVFRREGARFVLRRPLAPPDDDDQEQGPVLS